MDDVIDAAGAISEDADDNLWLVVHKAAITALQRYAAPGSGVLAREREALIRATAAQLALLDEQDRELRRKLERASQARFSP